MPQFAIGHVKQYASSNNKANPSIANLVNCCAYMCSNIFKSIHNVMICKSLTFPLQKCGYWSCWSFICETVKLERRPISYSLTVTFIIFARSASMGASVDSVFKEAILSTTSSIPDITFPNTVYCPSRKFESFKTMKNCEPALSGFCDLAIDNAPRECFFLLNSASIFQPGPPVPHLLLSAPPLVLGSPP